MKQFFSRLSRPKPTILSLLLTGVTLFSLPLSSSAQRVVAPEGHLILAGGGPLADTGILEKFLELAGGPTANIILIPTASGLEAHEAPWRGKQFERLGATNVTILDTKDRNEANSDSFGDAIKSAHAVWISGGRQWRLADSYLDTGVHDELIALLKRGGVIGGSSAGATIQGSYLARGDTKTNTIMMGDHERGFAFIEGVAVDQHLLKRNRQFDLIEIIEAKPELLGIGLDESTAILVSGNEFEVIGKSYVAIYDYKSSIDSGGQFYFLASGDKFNLIERRALRDENDMERVVDRTWPDDN